MEKLTPEERVARLEEKLGQSFGERPLLLAALTHKSYANEHPGEQAIDNERLEWLGDAVVDLAISDRLMERFPNASEGELSRMRALLVNEDGLARVARSMGLGELLLLGRGEDRSGGRQRSSLLADALEAVLGAVYLVGGMGRVMEVVDRHFGPHLAAVADPGGADYKSMLQVEVQRRLRIAPWYRVVFESSGELDKTFEVEVVIGEEPFGRASGRTKKEAEQGAAHLALLRLAEPPPED